MHSKGSVRAKDRMVAILARLILAGTGANDRSIVSFASAYCYCVLSGQAASGSAQLVLRLGLSRDWPLSTALGQRRAGVLAVLERDFNLLGTTPRVSNA